MFCLSLTLLYLRISCKCKGSNTAETTNDAHNSICFKKSILGLCSLSCINKAVGSDACVCLWQVVVET